MVKRLIGTIPLFALFLLVSTTANSVPSTTASAGQTQGNCGVTYEMHPKGIGLPGNFLNISSTFTNRGSTDSRVVVIFVYSSFGQSGSSTQYGMLNSTVPGVTVSSSPIMIPARSKVEHDLPLFIPDNAQPGEYNATSWAYLQCYSPASSSWTAPEPSLATSAILTVTHPPYPLWVKAVTFGAVATVLATMALIIGLRASRPSKPHPRSPPLPPYFPSD
jgi:hypothetical protein